MLRALNSAISGLQQFQGELDVIGNNISNANTTGYKAARMDFEDAFSQTLRVASADTATGGGGTAGMQIGAGVSTSSIMNRFTQGALTTTGVQTDLAISGEGFFVVRDAVSGQDFVTRAGNFRRDNQGYLVTTEGYRLQGFNNAGLNTRGDLIIDGAGRPATADPNAVVEYFGIDNKGQINVRLSDGTNFVRGQVLLQNFNDPQALMKAGGNLYSGLDAAGPIGGASPLSAAPGTAGLGKIQAGALELSNVDLTSEFANLITTQRAFQANARIVTTSDEVLQELVSLKR